MDKISKESVIIIFSSIASAVIGATVNIISKNLYYTIGSVIAIFFFALFLFQYISHYKEKKSIGAERIFSSFGQAPSILELIKEARKEFCFLGISARSFFESEEIEDILKKKTREGCKFKFLLLNPNSQNLARKAKDENDSPTAWKNDIEAGIKRLETLRREIGPDKFDFRTYSIFPIWRGIFIDDIDAYISYYPHGHRGKYSPIIHFRNIDKSFFNPFKDYFIELWGG